MSQLPQQGLGSGTGGTDSAGAGCLVFQKEYETHCGGALLES